ncbi:MAG: LssY C-terminal domain-containing protein [Patescibacteria group bacterium]
MDIINNLLPTLEHVGVFGYWIVFFVALLESLAFVGSFVPGATIVVFAGVLSAKGYLDIGDLIWFAAVGAILGDSISYWLGTKGTKFFRNENKFLKLAHLERGEAFFARHGPKSIFFGRFVGPIRSIVPFIAGLSKMKQRTFLLWNISGGVLWAVAHVSLGYFFGEILHSAEAWISRAGLVIVVGLLVALLMWIIIKKSRPVVEFLSQMLSSLKKIVFAHPYSIQFVKKYPQFSVFLSARFARNRFTGMTLTLLSVAFFYVLVLFLGIVQDVVVSDVVVVLDMRIANLLFAFRDDGLTQVFLWITLLGKWQVVLFFTFVASILLWIWNKRMYVIPFWVALLGSEAVNFFGKLAVHRPRPEVAAYVEKSFSFPSGHATIAVAFYGFLAYALWQHDATNWKRRANILFATILVILAIGFSRLYLGVHFLSDVWGGYLLGALWLIIAISVSKWLVATEKNWGNATISPRSRKIISWVLVAGAFLFYVVMATWYHPASQVFLKEKPQVVGKNIVSAFLEYGLPYQTETLVGNSREPINVIVVTDSEQGLVDAVTKAGWSRADDLTIGSAGGFLRAAFLGKEYLEAPLAPSFWNNETHTIGFEKAASAGAVGQRHHVRFWRTNLTTKEGGLIYVGTVGFDKNIRQMLTYQIDMAMDEERELLFADLRKAGVVASSHQEQGGAGSRPAVAEGEEFFGDGSIDVIFLR